MNESSKTLYVGLDVHTAPAGEAAGRGPGHQLESAGAAVQTVQTGYIGNTSNREHG